METSYEDPEFVSMALDQMEAEEWKGESSIMEIEELCLLLRIAIRLVDGWKKG